MVLLGRRNSHDATLSGQGRADRVYRRTAMTGNRNFALAPRHFPRSFSGGNGRRYAARGVCVSSPTAQGLRTAGGQGSVHDVERFTGGGRRWLARDGSNELRGGGVLARAGVTAAPYRDRVAAVRRRAGDVESDLVAVPTTALAITEAGASIRVSRVERLLLRKLRRTLLGSARK